MKKTLSKPKKKILYELSIYGAMTADQIVLACFRPTLNTWGRQNVKELVAQGYLWEQQLSFHRKGESGAFGSVYGLQSKGTSAVREYFGTDEPLRPLSEEKRSHLGKHPHDLLINDVLLAALAFAQTSPAWDLLALRHESALRRELAGQPAVPDGYLRFGSGDRRDVIFLEVDQSGKEDKRAWTHKVRSLLRMLHDADFQERYINGAAVTIAVVVDKGETRLQNLLRWTELADRTSAEYFLFSPVAPITLSSTDYFMTRHWHGSGRTRPAILLDDTV